jgi:hypothetical protein
MPDIWRPSHQLVRPMGLGIPMLGMGGRGVVPGVTPYRSLSFDGDAFAQKASPSGLPTGMSATWTIECWTKPTSFAAAIIAASWGNTASTRGPAIQFTADPLYSVQNWGDAKDAPSPTPQLSTWVHLAAAMGGDDEVHIFANGALIHSAAMATNPGTDVLSLGCAVSLAHNFFVGEITLLRMWDIERNAAAVTSTMLLSELSDDTVGLVGQWKFQDEPGQTLLDSSANANHMTLGADPGTATDDPAWIGPHTSVPPTS